MQRKTDKKTVYNAGKGKLNQDLIYMHMSNHYRRILNAKKMVDTSPPYCYKAKRPATSVGSRNNVNKRIESPALTDRSISTNSNKGSCWGGESYTGSSKYHARCFEETPTFTAPIKHDVIDMDLVDRIAYDTKNGPGSYCDGEVMRKKARDNPKSKPENVRATKPDTSVGAKRRLQSGGSHESAQKRKLELEKKLKASGKSNNKFCSRSLKVEAVSKLRGLRVYHPPRPKPSRSEREVSSKTRLTSSSTASNCKCTKICVCDTSETVVKKSSFNPKEQSLTSSRDSAYNGGVSSLPESRSPTPDNRRKKDCCCCCCEKKHKAGKFFETRKPEQQVMEVSETPNANVQEESLKKIQEDALYVKFIQDITSEVLEKNLYTNKALKKVMKRHIKRNLDKLNKSRMLKEVDNLRIQLGIPEDKSLLALDPEVEEEKSELRKYYPVISDSEFVPPNNKDVKGNVTSSTDDKPSLSSSTEEDGEVVSVIQVTKSIREKRKEKTMEPKATSRENSSDDSNRVFDSKKRSAFKNLKQKLMRTYSSSSSDSDLSRTLTKKVREKTEGEIFEKTYLGQKSSKKNRNVSFWKNPELRTVETTTKTVVSESIAVVDDETQKHLDQQK